MKQKKDFIVSCIIPIYKVEAYLCDAIESVLRQSIGFSDHIQLILVNDGSPDNCGGICQRYLAEYPENICYIEQENAGVSSARNAGLDLAHGKYIAFLDGDDMFEDNYLEIGVSFFEQHFDTIDVVAFPLKYFGNTTSNDVHPLNYKFTFSRIVDIRRDYTQLQAHIASTIIKREVLEQHRFRLDLDYAEDAELLHRIITQKQRYGICTETALQYRKRFDGNSALQSCHHNIAWYKKLLIYPRLLIENTLKNAESLPKYTQFAIMYDLQWYKLESIPDSILESIDMDMLLKELSWIVQHLDAQIIKEAKHLNYWQKYYLLKLKYKKIICLDQTADGTPAFYFDDILFQKLFPTVWITLIEEHRGNIVIGGYYVMAKYDSLPLVSTYNGRQYDCSSFHQKHRDTFFLGQCVQESRSFLFEIPYSGEGTISFFIQAEDYGLFPVKLDFGYSSRLRNNTGAFLLGDQSILFKTEKSNSVDVKPFSKKALRSALRFYLKQNVETVRKRDRRILKKYLRYYPFFQKKHIWLFMDRQNKADDNAEHLFRFCSSQKDRIKKYFIIEKNAPDAERMKKYGKVINYGSEKHLLLSLFANKFVAACFDFKHIFPYGDRQRIDLFIGLANSEFVFLQHGVTKDDMSSIFDRLTKNIKTFVTAAPEEYSSIVQNPNYGYSSDTVILTGFPRYDNLYNNPKKKIVFMPTWRSDLQPLSLEEYRYNPHFKFTEYCKTISLVLKDERLISALKLYGYELIFRPHPMVYYQIDDFSMDPYVQIAPFHLSYQKLFAEAALVITDYSSAVFDFAYLKKPVIYYQFDKSHYEKGYFDYTAMGFGEVVSSHEELIDLLIHHVQNQCTMGEEYRCRVDRFFAYTDHNNCKRIYDHLIQNERNGTHK